MLADLNAGFPFKVAVPGLLQVSLEICFFTLIKHRL
jgi:hypothetical protein